MAGLDPRNDPPRDEDRPEPPPPGILLSETNRRRRFERRVQRTVDLVYLEELYAKAERLRTLLEAAELACASYPFPTDHVSLSDVDIHMEQLRSLL